MLVHCFEEQINQVHPVSRLNNAWCVLPKFAFDPCERNPLSMMNKISKLRCKVDLVDTFNTERREPYFPYHYRAYNFGNVLDSKKCTVEFRQHMGTLDRNAITRWIALTGELMMAAHRADLSIIVGLVTKHCHNDGFTILDLLRELNLGFIANSYQNHLYDHSNVKVKDPWICEYGQDRPEEEEET